ncbi:MAG: hypothetical protein H7Y17_07225, partial [Chlorobia bacterium]|nr:hypothetical protein [Fimbriimonadaceae bacterium]
MALILLASPTHPFETPYLDPNSFILRPANILGRQEKDTDSDGLPDSWETKGHGPLVPSRHGCNPRRADMIVVTCNEAALSRADAQRQIDRMRAFYATVPGRNPDGSTGINIIHIWGNEFTAADAATPYPALYARGVPAEWRDLAHGLYITASSGGGQNDAPTWAIVINHWAAMAHELGH